MRNIDPIKNLIRQAAAMAIIATSLLSTIATAQKKPASSPPKGPDKIAAHKGKVGWSGVITYRKTLNDDFNSDEQLFGSVNPSERIKHTQSRNYEYQGRIIVRDFEGTGKAATTANVSLHDSDYHKVVQTELTNCHSWEPSRTIKAESTDRKVTDGSAQGEAVSYSLSTNGDRFSLSFTLPAFQGRYTHTEKSSYSNLCPDSTRKPSTNTSTTDVKVPEGGASIEGQIDPKNPDEIVGTRSWSDSTSKIKSFTHTVTWRFRRKPQPLIITDIHFYQPIFPKPDDWKEIPDDKWAIDGNQVKVVATIANLAATEKTATVNFRELKENKDLPNGAVTATVPGNGQKDVEFIWDTSGYAWHTAGSSVVPQKDRTIEARIPDDQMTKDIKIDPKPVVLVWGLWQSADAMRKFRTYFGAVTENWAITDGMTDVRKVTTDNAAALDRTIKDIERDMNAWHVDLVGVQNGGLVARVYVNSLMATQFDGRPAATHLAMVGVPNLGTPCADGIYGLSFKLNTFNWDAMAELSPDSMKRFNLLVNNTNGTRFAALAVRTRNSVCQEETPGDGFATIPSAIWRTKVNAVMRAQVTTREIMGEVAHFRQVFKWIAIPPEGDHSPDPGTLAANLSKGDSGIFKLASLSDLSSSLLPAGGEGDEKKPQAALVATLKPGKTTEVELPVPAGTRIAVVFMASPGVSATLSGEDGQVMGTSLSSDEGADDIFRTITVKAPFPAGKMKLKFEGNVAAETEIPVMVYVSSDAAVKSLS